MKRTSNFAKHKPPNLHSSSRRHRTRIRHGGSGKSGSASSSSSSSSLRVSTPPTVVVAADADTTSTSTISHSSRWGWWGSVPDMFDVFFWLILAMTTTAVCYVAYFAIVPTYASSGVIPNKVWSFWDTDELPEFYDNCIASWKHYNPSHEIVVLSPQNVHLYIDDCSFLRNQPFKGDSRLTSDMVRLQVLSKYGGFWMDTSVICNDSIQWLHDLQQQKQVEYIGFFADRFTSTAFRIESPIIESWMFGCIPNSAMVNAWRMEFENIDKKSKKQELETYVTDLKDKYNISPQNIGVSAQVYLVVYLSLQKVLQSNPGKFKFHVIASDTSALIYLENNEWNSEKAVDDLVKRATTNYCKEQRILKICKEERFFLLQRDYNVLFTLWKSKSDKTVKQ